MVSLQYYFLLHSKINVIHTHIFPLFKVFQILNLQTIVLAMSLRPFFFVVAVVSLVPDCSGFPLKPQVPQIQWMENHGEINNIIQRKTSTWLGFSKCPAIACLLLYSLSQLSVINIYLARHANTVLSPETETSS